MVLDLSTLLKYGIAIFIITAPAVWVLFAYGPRRRDQKTKKWFEQLKKPSYTPSNELFSFLWILTYAIMGVAVFMIFEQLRVYQYSAISALTIFTVQYILGISLFPVFFGLKDLVLTGFLISALIPMIFWTMLEFYKLSTTAFILLIPYAGWIGFLTVLSFDFIKMNHRQIHDRFKRTTKTARNNQTFPKTNPPKISNHV